MNDAKDRQQHGQAMPEFLVAMLALVPLFIIVPYLAQYIEVAHSTTSASRFAGYEASMYHKVKFEHPAELHFAHQEFKITTEDEEAEVTEKIKKYFYDNYSAKTLVDEVEVTREYEEEERYLKNMEGRSSWDMAAVGVMMGMGHKDYRVVNVNATLKELPWDASVAGPTKMERYMVVAYNEWSAYDPEDVKKHILRPGYHFPRHDVREEDAAGNSGQGDLITLGLRGALTDDVDTPMPLITLLNMMDFHTDFGVDDILEFDPDIVPEDRLGGGGGSGSDAFNSL